MSLAIKYAQELVDSFDNRAHGRRVVDVFIDERFPLWAKIVFHDTTSCAVTGFLACEIIQRVRQDHGLEPAPQYRVQEG